MRPYSTDFRLKVVRAYEQGEGSQRELAHIFGVSLSFIQDLLQRYRQTGSVEPKPHGGGNPGKVRPYLGLIQHLHQQQPDASLAEGSVSIWYLLLFIPYGRIQCSSYITQ